MAASPSSLVVTYGCLPKMPAHSEMIITTHHYKGTNVLSPNGCDPAELVVSSSQKAGHSEWTDEFIVPVQQTTLSAGELVIGKVNK